MINKIYEFSLDAKNSTYIPKMEFYKNDVDTSKIEITLRNGYEIVNLVGCTIVCKILKSDDTEIQNIVDIVDAEAGLMSINLSSQALAVLGTSTVQLSIYEGLKRLSMHEFTYTVIDTVIGEEGILSQNEYPILTQLIADVQAIENIINTSEVTRVANEETRINNETTRETNEANREILKGQMDTLKSSLESLKSSLETLETNVSASETTRQSNETDRELLKANLESLKTTLEALDTTLNNNEAARGNTFDTKINAIDNKIVDVEGRCVAKETLIDNKIVDVEARAVAKENSVDSKISEANTTIANTNVAKANAETATTNANAKITETEATRQSIINTINSLVSQFNALAPAESTNAEVQLARTDVTGKTYASLQERLLADNKQQNIMYSSVEGAYISSDSVDGWVKDVVVEGNTYQNPALLSDIRSTGDELADGRFEIPLLCRSKNICSYTESGGINTSTGENVTSGTDSRTGFIRVEQGLQYKTSLNGVAKTVNILYYDINKKFVSYASTGSTYTVPANCYYVRHFFGGSGIGFQLEEGTTVTSYESPQEHQITILSDVQIEKVGTVADRIVEVSDNIWDIEKNIADAKLNGSEGWTIHNTYTDTIAFINTDKFANCKDYSTCISDKFRTDLFGNEDIEHIRASIKSIIVYVSKSKLATLDVAGFKTWLSQNNILVKYQLATPVYYPLADNQQVALKTFANKTNISFLTEIEGTIKCDVPKSTSASVNAITEKVNAIDKDLERVKKLEDATTSTVVTDNSFVNISDSTNGYLADLKLEGRTLNQLIKNGNFANGTTSWSASSATLSASNNVLSITGSGSSNVVGAIHTLNRTFNANSKVYIRALVRVTNSVATNLSAYVYGSSINPQTVGLTSTPISSQWYLISTTINTIATGDISIKLQTYYADTTTATGKVMEVQNVMALDLTSLGMTNFSADEINGMLGGYFEGLKSVGQDVNKIVVSSIKDNFFDDNNWSFELKASSTQTAIPFTLPFKEFSYMLFKDDLTQYRNSNIAFRLLDSNKAEINWYGFSVVDGNMLNKTCDRYKDVRYIQFFTNASMTDNLTLHKFVLRKGNTQLPTSYISHQSDKKEILYLDTADSTWKKPVFRGIWSNGVMTVGDTVEKHSDGKYYYHKRCEQGVLDGTSNLSLWTASNEVNTKGFLLNLTGNKTSKPVISDKLKTASIQNDIVNNDEEAIWSWSTDGKITFRLLKTKATDLAAASTYLTTNPIAFVYELAQEQIYECTPIDLASYDSETNYYLESGVLCPRSTIKVQSYIGSIINTMKEKISIQENTNNFSLAMLLDHEVRLSLIEGGMI